jgi:hypothetical protein
LSGLENHIAIPGLTMPEIPDLVPRGHLPSVPHFSPPSVSAPSLGGDGADLWLWLVALAVVGFALWRMSAARRAGAGANAGWRLGPWPVAPAAIATRRELVAAFEYLALLYLGPDARACHHLDLAARLGAHSVDAERRRAADELAHLYEQARYAPDDDQLSPDELAAARHDLCYLAGVAAA